MFTFDCVSEQLSGAACRFLAKLQEFTASKVSSTSIFRQIKDQFVLLSCCIVYKSPNRLNIQSITRLMHDGRSKGIVQCILFELQITIFLSSPPPVFRQKYGGQLSISNSLGYIQKSKNNYSEWFFYGAWEWRKFYVHLLPHHKKQNLAWIS